MVGSDRPYVLRGFDIIQPQDSIGTESVSITVANSVAYYPSATAGSFFYGLEDGNTNALPLIPELRKNATNFVYLTFDTFDTAQDSRAFWDPDQNGGAGGEFSQDINTESVLSVAVGVSVSTFPENTIPIAKIVVGPSVIASIQDCRDMMFRLGTGGITPDPFSTFTFRSEPSSAYTRDEPLTTMTSALDPNPFEGGDKNIFTMKEWMDVVMSIIKEVTGGTYWYSAASATPGSGPNLPNTWEDALGSTLKSKGEWVHDGTTAGRVSWSEDVVYHSLTDPRELIIRAAQVDIATNDDVAYIEFVRNEEINGTSTAATFANIEVPAASTNFFGSMTGPVGTFANLTKGDWVKKISDPDYLFLRVEEFYAATLFGGGTTTPALAQSVRLSAQYAGAAGSSVGEYTKGEYLVTDVKVEPRNTNIIDDVGGNFFWLAYRSDTILGLQGITPTQLSVDITDADGTVATCTSAAHGLVDGDRVTITTGGYAGTFQVAVEDVNTFYINTAVTGDEAGQTAFYAVVQTRARSTAFSYALESANHGFESNQRITIQGTSTSYDASYLINNRTATTFQIPIGSLLADPGIVDGEIVVLARVNVKTEFGTVKVVQGESIDIGDPDTTNILSYIGMPSLAMTAPVYQLPLGYNALNGMQDYNSTPGDDLTTRVAQLTAMMADRVQDRGFNFRGRVNITSVTSGANQDISATGNLTLHKPSSPEQVIDLTTTINLPANSAVIATVGRDVGTTITPTVISLGNTLVLGENDLIMFYRFAGTTVYTWLDEILEPAGHINTQYPEDSQNRNVFVFNPGITQFNSGTGLLSFDIDDIPEISAIACGTGASLTTGDYFTINSANDATSYYVWYNVDGGLGDPAPGGTGIPVVVGSGDTDIQIADATVLAINTLAAADFTADNAGGTLNTITVTNDATGPSTDAADVNTGFTISTTQAGADPDPEIIINGSTNINTIDSDTINGLGTLILTANQACWVRVNRNAAKTFNTVSTTDVPDTDGAGALYVTNITDVPIDQDVFVMYVRRGDNLIEMHKGVSPDMNVYEEKLTIVAGAPADDSEVTGPVVANTNFSLPLDSRDSNSIQTYLVGAGHLQIHLGGQALVLGEDFIEIGSTGAESTLVQFLQTLVVDDRLEFRIDGNGSVFFASTGTTGGTLQDAYDKGRFITVASGQPITIGGPASEKLFVVNGDIDVTGVIDPIGLELTPIAADPLGGGNGLWVNLSNELVYEGTSIKMDLLKINATTLTEAQLINIKTMQDGSDIVNTLHHHDNRYYTETEIGTTGVTSGASLVGINDAGGYFASSFVEGALQGLNTGELDHRYYTETEIDANIYTKTQLDAGQLDNRYYTEVELVDFSNATPGSILVGDDPTGYTNITPVSSAQEQTSILVNNNGAFFDFLGSGFYFTINSALDATAYYIWYNVTDGANVQADPTPGGTGIQVDVLLADSVNSVALKTSSAINLAAAADFTAGFLAATVTVTNVLGGATTDAVDISTGHTIAIPVQGTTVAGTGSVRNTLLAIDATLASFSKLFVTKTNNSGVVIPSGSVVVASKTTGEEILAANAVSLATCECVLGVTIAAIPNGASGQVQITGEVDVLGATALGERVYVSDTVAGQVVLTANVPTALNSVAYVVGSTIDTGKILLGPNLVYVNE